MIEASKLLRIYKYFDFNGIPFKEMVTIGGAGVVIRLKIPFYLTNDEQFFLVRKYFKDTLRLDFKNCEEIIDFSKANNFPAILVLNEHNATKKIYLAKEVINGNLITRDKKWNKGFKSLGCIKHIKGDFGIDSILNDIGRLNRVDGDMWFSNYLTHNLKTLKPLTLIKGNLMLRWTNASLGTLKRVEGNLNIRKTEVRDLGDLNYVGGNILISKVNEMYYDFSKIIIKGKIRKYNDVFDINKPHVGNVKYY